MGVLAGGSILAGKGVLAGIGVAVGRLDGRTKRARRVVSLVVHM